MSDKEERIEFVQSLDSDLERTDVLDRLEEKFDLSRGGLRAFLKRTFEEDPDRDDFWNEVTEMTAECPDCGLQAVGMGEVDEKFGFREVGGTKYAQSYCRECR